MKFKSLTQFLDHFKTEESCIKLYEKLRWNDSPTCPHCGSKKPYVLKKGYKCSNSECYKVFTVKIGTIFENSKIPFRTWFAAFYLISAHKKGISSLQLATDLGVTQKTAWFMLQRIREAMKNQMPTSFSGEKIIEVDETHVGGKEDNRHKNKKRYKDTDLANDGTPYNKKKVVIGIVERGGKIALKKVEGAKTECVIPVVRQYAPAGSLVMTDESSIYFQLRQTHTHSTVNHSAKIFAEGEAHTNTIENFFSILKRGINGIYHQVSDKHLDLYLNEFASRYNTRHIDPFQRLEKFLTDTSGSLLYKNLTRNDKEEKAN